jgi:hypothetical protein
LVLLEVEDVEEAKEVVKEAKDEDGRIRFP